ncbi:DUF2225 domain-containing protein [Leptospira sp. GIMC2001]|uniref:DUF2225 domain-containing protein n=1 Tax=Leptospira sp. GIMC2001 TaxID=1513297 RepID=UPI0023495523|nr:DUF2225 domain-containing protein [Leptospira sp. GIMC2001]WCL50046.1 DUF2225 domain-containing protein [Leptospira sp. GIMC2001]
MAVSTASQNKKISFRAKENSVCPVCNEVHQKEQMFQGGGRLIAGKLTQELRRLYEKNKKFGRVGPNDYIITVCPRCLYASFNKDWDGLAANEAEALRASSDQRRSFLEKILGPLDFNEDRNIILGVASYLLAIECYQKRGLSVAPTPKKALCAIRAAWYFDDLTLEFPDLKFNEIRDFMFKKAAIYYSMTLELMQNGQEPVDSIQGMLGPDSDNNWGFDGVVYLNAYLTRKFLSQLAEKKEDQLNLLIRAKRMLARLYGSGKSSKGKPSAIIEMARELYDEYGALIEEMGGEK